MSFLGAVGSFFSSPAGLGALTGGVGSLASTWLSSYFNKKAAKQSYGYAQEMRNSAHQVEVQDLIKAGLNPVLSAQGNGASTVSVPVQGGQVQDIGAGVARGMEKGLQFEQQKSVISANNATAANQNAQAAQAFENAELAAQKAESERLQNIYRLAESSWFQQLPDSLKYDIISSKMYPSSTTGQMRSMAAGAADAVQEGFGKAGAWSVKGAGYIKDAAERAGYKYYEKMRKQEEEINRDKNKLHKYLERKQRAGYLF